jgi:hypothetical protein
VLACVLVAACAASKSAAPGRMLDLNKAALTDYRKGRSEQARKRLLEAVEIGKRAGLEQHAMMARTQLLLGVVYAGGLKDRNKAVTHMGIALKIQPQTVLSKSLATPPVRKAFNEARDEARAAQVAAREAEKKARVAEKERKVAEKRETEKERKVAERERAREAEREKAAEKERAREAEKERKVAEKERAREAEKEKAAEKERKAAEAHKEKAAERGRKLAEAEKEKAEKERKAAEEKETADKERRAAEAEKEKAAEKEKTRQAEKEKEALAMRAAINKPADNEEPDLPADIPQPLYCPAPDEAPPETEVVLRCVTQPGLRLARLLLYYRPPGTETFTEVAMSRSSKGWYTGVVPSQATSGTSLQYYVEAKGGAAGAGLANGKAESPNLMMVREGAPPVGRGTLAAARFRSNEPSVNVDENPLADLEKEHDLERTAAGLHRRPAGRPWAAFGLGTGEGWQAGKALEFRTDQKVNAGPLSGGLVHVLPELGYQLSDDYAVSVQLRYQYISIEGQGDGTQGSPAGGALSLLVKGYWFWGDGNAQLFGTASVGGGQGFRLVVPPTEGANLRTDTVRGGPLIAGPGVGFAYHFNRRVAWAGELRLLAGVPDFAAVGELGMGVQVGF